MVALAVGVGSIGYPRRALLQHAKVANPSRAQAHVGDSLPFLGTVVDRNETPIAAARLRIFPLEGENDTAGGQAANDAAPLLELATDSQGQFRTELSPGRYRAIVDGDGLVRSEANDLEVPGDAVRLVAIRAQTLSGVVNDQGRPAADTTVELMVEATGVRRSVITKADGVFLFADVPDGGALLWAYGPEVATRVHRVAEAGQDVQLTLEPATIVVARVRSTDGQPVAADAELEALDEEEFPPRFATASADGVVRFEGVLHGRYSLGARADGYVVGERVLFTTGATLPTVELQRGATVRGRVVDEAGRPVAQAELWFEADNGRTTSAWTLAEAARRFAGEGVGPRWGLGAGNEFIPRGELGVVRGPIPYPPIHEPSGQAVLQMAALAPSSQVEAAVWQRWSSDADGAFVIDGLAAQAGRIAVRSHVYSLGHSLPLVLPSGGELRDVVIVLRRGSALLGTVLDESGAPVAGARVVARSMHDQRDVSTDAAGRYRLGPVQGTYDVRITAFGFSDFRFQAVVDDTSVTADPVILVRASAELRGEILDPTGLPVVDADVRIAKGPITGRRDRSTQAGFVLRHVPSGDYELEIRHRDYPLLVVSASTREPARAMFAWGGGLRGSVFDAHTGQALPGAHINLRRGEYERDISADPDGSFAARALLPGTYAMRTSHSGYVDDAQEIDVAPGTSIGAVTADGLRVALRRGCILAGFVRDAYGRRIAKADVVAEAEGQRSKVRSDEEGRFRIRDAPTGEVRLTVVYDGRQGTLVLTTAPGDERLDVVIDVE